VLVEEFLNTPDVRSFIRRGIRFVGTDAPDTPAAPSMWLCDRSLENERDVATTSDLQIARALRDVLRRATDPNVSSPADPTDVLAQLTLRLRIEENGEQSLGRVAKGIEGALAGFVAVVPKGSQTGPGGG
jgi:hypothetical protein